MPAFSISKKLSISLVSLLCRSLHLLEEKEQYKTPSPQTYDQGSYTINEEVNVYLHFLYIRKNRKTETEKLRKEKYREFLQKQKEEWKKKRDALRAQNEQQLEDQNVMETAISSQITDTRTLSYKVDIAPSKVVAQTQEKEAPEEKPPTGPPGPGSYNLIKGLDPEEIKKSYNAIGFGYHSTSQKQPREQPVKLGPGAYTLPMPKKGPSFAFGDRFDGIPFDHPKLLARRQLAEKEFHQPEFMPPVDYVGRSPGVKMSPPPKDRNKKFDAGIGPGSYDTIVAGYSPKYTMTGGKSKQTLEPSTLPGPGQYKPEAAMGYLFPQLAKSISVVVPEIKQGYSVDTPGPGAYNPKHYSTVPGLK